MTAISPRLLKYELLREPDGSLRPVAEREADVVVCPRCGAEVTLVEDVEEWDPATGEILGWGPALGFHCGMLLAAWWEGAFAFDLEATDAGKS